jgi:two-component system sensor histidine kinase KdpD
VQDTQGLNNVSATVDHVRLPEYRARVPGDGQPKKAWKRGKPLLAEPLVLWGRYLRALGITVLCTAIAYPLYPHFDPVNIVMVYLLGTTVAGLRLGRGPSALCAVANAVAFDFFFVPPRFSFYISETQYLFTLGVMLGVALVIANLMINVRRQTEAAAAREQRTSILYALSRDLTMASDVLAIAEVSARHAGLALEGAAAVLLVDEQGAIRIPPGMQDAVRSFVDIPTAQWAVDRNESVGPGLQRAESLPALYLPLACSGKVRGAFIVKPNEIERVTLEQQRLLEALAGHIALSLERAQLIEMEAASRAAAERAALRNTLLASISHDLRGPLSAIAGAGSLVAQSSNSLDLHRRKTLGQLIEEKALDMSDLLANVLELMRLETSRAPPKAEWHSLEDLVGTAITNNEHRLVGRRLTARIAADFPLIFVDGQLVVQLLSNLFENASKHTPSGTSITVSAERRSERAVLIVDDDGPGFGNRDPETLFEKFERGVPESHIAGVGLGLAICRAIVVLHGGAIHASNRPGGGARFEIELPMQPLQAGHPIEQTA